MDFRRPDVRAPGSGPGSYGERSAASAGDQRSTVSTSNSGSGLHELPRFPSTSSDASSHQRQRVQELFDAGQWRQVRVDLGDFAGQSDLKLRFDFSTAGRMPTAVGAGSPYANLNSSIEGHGS